MGETLGELSSLVLNLISIYLFTSRTCKNSHVEILFYFFMEKSKAEKSPWVKKTKETGPKKKEKAPFCQAKINNLAESDKDSWFGQTLTTSSASAEDPERSKTLLARILPLPLPLASLAIITWSTWIEMHWAMQKKCCNAMLFPETRDLVS